MREKDGSILNDAITKEKSSHWVSLNSNTFVDSTPWPIPVLFAVGVGVVLLDDCTLPVGVVALHVHHRVLLAEDGKMVARILATTTRAPERGCSV